uniref:Uncharacterized protein n=1 Tax=viral metagenome TaxID=1070528 RepID=A0A6M3J5Y8_9ZZZZ
MQSFGSLITVPKNILEIEGNNLSWRIRIRFESKVPPHEYISPDIRYNNPGWANQEIFNAPIKSFEFFLPIKQKIYMEGMKDYNFFIEAIGDMIRSKAKIDSFWFCGHTFPGNFVISWKVKQGVIEKKMSLFGKEYYNTASAGWKQGVVSMYPIAIIMPTE